MYFRSISTPPHLACITTRTHRILAPSKQCLVVADILAFDSEVYVNKPGEKNSSTDSGQDTHVSNWYAPVLEMPAVAKDNYPQRLSLYLWASKAYKQKDPDFRAKKGAS